jgi:PAS domain S-box-containing protein
MKSAIPTRSAIDFDGLVACVLLSFLGVFGNYIHIELFFSVDFLFGGVAVLLAMSILGWHAGSFVGFIASLYTYVLWGHPYAILIFTCEAIVVGFLSQRKRWSLTSSEVAYWFTIGIPLVYYCYHGRMGVPGLSAWTIALKQASNGLFCAFLVSAILFLPIVHQLTSRLDRVPPRPLQGVLVELTIAFAFFAMLFSISLDSNLARKEAENTVYGQLKMVAENTLNQVAVWQQWNGNNTKLLADLVRTQYYPIELTITLESKHPDFRIEHNSGASSIAPMEFSTVHYIRDRLDQYFPVGDMPSMKRWSQSVYQWRVPPSGSSPWSLTIASSAAPQITKLEALYSAKLLRLLATTGAIVLLSNVTAYILSQPIVRLNQVLTDPQSFLWAGLSADRAAESEDSFEEQSRPERSGLGSVNTIREFRNLDHHLRRWVNDWQQQLDALTYRNAQLDRLVLMASEDYEKQARIARQYEQASIETRQRLNAIVQYAPIVMIEWRLDRSILAWNPAAEKLFGYTSVEVLGRDLFSTILPDREAIAMLHAWQNLVDLTGGHHSTHETITKEGKAVICDWFNRPILTRGGAIVSIISVLREVAIVDQSGFLSKSG